MTSSETHGGARRTTWRAGAGSVAWVLVATAAAAQPAPGRPGSRPSGDGASAPGAVSGDEASGAALTPEEAAREKAAYAAIARQIERERNPGQDLNPPYLSGGRRGGATLRLGKVQDTASRHYPGLQVGEAKIDAARAERLKAAGGFDLQAVAKGGYNPLGKYREGRFMVGLEQPTGLWGARFYAQYRRGRDFPVYYTQYATSDLGEAAIGAVVPLWKGGPIDERRLELRLAELGVSMAEADLELKRIMVAFQAAAAYWKWVASGRNENIAKALLRIAKDRDRGISEQVRRGGLSAVTVADNVRLIAERQVQLIQARRKLRQSALKLAMYYRDRSGNMVVAKDSALPADFPVLKPPRKGLAQAAYRRALERRPEMRVVRLAMKREMQQVSFGRNIRGPALDVGVEVSQDFGKKYEYVPFAETSNDLKLGLTLSMKWPIQQRKGRGLEQKALAKLRVLQAEQRFLKDQIRAQVMGATIDLDAAYRESINARKAYLAAYRMEVAERERFNQGRSDLLYVNVREDKTASAAMKYVKALERYFVAKSRLEAVQGGSAK